MLCRASNLSLYTLNGDLLLEQNVCVEGEDLIASCAFYEGTGNEYLERDLIFTGHRRGVVNVSRPVVRIVCCGMVLQADDGINRSGTKPSRPANSSLNTSSA